MAALAKLPVMVSVDTVVEVLAVLAVVPCAPVHVSIHALIAVPAIVAERVAAVAAELAVTVACLHVVMEGLCNAWNSQKFGRKVDPRISPSLLPRIVNLPANIVIWWARTPKNVCRGR